MQMRVLPSVQPFHAIAYPIDAMLALEISQKYAEHCSLIASRFGAQSFNHPPAVHVKSEGGSGRLRVGYVQTACVYTTEPLFWLNCPGFIKQSTVTCWSSNFLNIFLDEMIV
jgi:hypothetical protein